MTRDGNFLAVGAPQNSDVGLNTGRIYLFKYEDEMWVQHGENINGELEQQSIGENISMSDDGQMVATSSPYFNAPQVNGLAQVFKLQPTSDWAQVGTNIIGNNLEFLGISIGLSADGNTLVTGSPWHNQQLGEVRLFRFEDSDWQQWGDAISGDSPGGHFGYSVSVSADGNTLVAGAPDNSYNTTGSGLVQVYTLGVTSIDERTESMGIKIFPNPSQGSVTLQLATLPKSAKVSIVDLTGKKVYSAPVLQMQSVLDISCLSNGVYVVRLETNESVRIGKLVLNK